MNAHTYMMSCDWGTSSFRLRLVEIATGIVKNEVTSPQGIAKTFAAYSQAVTDNTIKATERVAFYTGYLQAQIELLAAQATQNLAGLPVIISGMASASIGLMELPYASLPFALDGTNALTTRTAATPNFPHDCILVSGVKSESDVMRGEETQLIGLAASIPIQQGVCLFPGTHSKHMYIQNHQLTDFKTYMTGELFQTIATHTILKASVEQTAEESFAKHETVFREGVNTAMKQDHLLHILFTVRTGELFRKFTKEQNYFYLSGILIGQELQVLQSMSGLPITLCCASNLLPYYQAAIDCLGLSSQTTVIPGYIIDTIVIAGQRQLLKINQ